jgi:hypothetical protein
MGEDNTLRRCVMEHEWHVVLAKAHEGIAGGNYAGRDITHKVLHIGLWCSIVHKDEK